VKLDTKESNKKVIYFPNFDVILDPLFQSEVFKLADNSKIPFILSTSSSKVILILSYSHIASFFLQKMKITAIRIKVQMNLNSNLFCKNILHIFFMQSSQLKSLYVPFILPHYIFMNYTTHKTPKHRMILKQDF